MTILANHSRHCYLFTECPIFFFNKNLSTRARATHKSINVKLLCLLDPQREMFLMYKKLTGTQPLCLYKAKPNVRELHTMTFKKYSQTPVGYK